MDTSLMEFHNTFSLGLLLKYSLRFSAYIIYTQKKKFLALGHRCLRFFFLFIGIQQLPRAYIPHHVMPEQTVSLNKIRKESHLRHDL